MDVEQPVVVYKSGLWQTVFIGIVLSILTFIIFDFSISFKSITVCILLFILLFTWNSYKVCFYQDRVIYNQRFFSTRVIFYDKIIGLEKVSLTLTGGGVIYTIRYIENGKKKKIGFGKEKIIGTIYVEDFFERIGINVKYR